MYRFIRKGEFPRNMDGQTKTEGQGIPGFISICSSVKVNFREIRTDKDRGTGDSRFYQYQFIHKGEFPRNMDGQTKTEGQGDSSI